ncbi:hypothetical protein M407DRAFT_29868 [Tulasnella calospora MUT 4182]|uniref:Uncharacterized protein n=1 Tax=Tulasnella calospora MUT 4182 TaxID=1051891 RepID=A0A0C3Q8B2_9AGAM|nr:hypothetical protein M407DRAFT_29868 [Tulasnella calospora MUT 4182]
MTRTPDNADAVHFSFAEPVMTLLTEQEAKEFQESSQKKFDELEKNIAKEASKTRNANRELMSMWKVQLDKYTKQLDALRNHGERTAETLNAYAFRSVAIRFVDFVP